MLREFYQWLSTPTAKLARENGLLYEAIALQQRAGRCALEWQPHIEQCHAQVHQIIASLAKTDRITVLGSGILLETPINNLISCFSEILLIDLVHLKPIRQIARQQPKIKLLEMDLSGVLTALDTWQPGNKLPDIQLPNLSDYQSDLIISANLMSQLKQPTIKKLAGKINDAELLAFQITLAQAHWHWLTKLPGKKLIFSDSKSEFLDVAGNLLETEDAQLGPLPKPDQTWWWNISPLGEISRHYSQRMQVNAWWLDSSKQ